MPSSMHSSVYNIHSALQPYVQGIIFNEIEIEQDGQQVDLFPVGHAVLSFSLDKLPLYFKDELISSFYNMTGQLTQHFRMRAVKGNYRTIMVLLKPYGAYRFFQIPQNPFQNHYFDIHSITPSFKTVSEQLDCTDDPDVFVHLITEWLIALFSAPFQDEKFNKVKACVDKMLDERGNGMLHEHMINYGQVKISMERHFKEVVGILPKQFVSITRFNHAYHYIKQNANRNWMDVVAAFNYFDQSHFIKEFKRYSGFTPSQLHQSLYSIAGHVKEIELKE